jgi:hypothetical protein
VVVDGFAHGGYGFGRSLSAYGVTGVVALGGGGFLGRGGYGEHE